MSIKEEKINSQSEAFSHRPVQPWHRNLLSSAELKAMYEEIDDLRKLLKEATENEIMYKNIVHFLVNNEAPESKLTEIRDTLKKS